MFSLLCMLVALALCVLAYVPCLCGWAVVAPVESPATMEAEGLSWGELEASLGTSSVVRAQRSHGPVGRPIILIPMTHPVAYSGKLHATSNYGLYGVWASGVPPCKCPGSLGKGTIPSGIDAVRTPSPPPGELELTYAENFKKTEYNTCIIHTV